MFRFLLTILCFIPLAIFSQIATSAFDENQNMNVLYRNEATGSVFVHSRGWGIQYSRLKHATGKRKRIMEFSFLNMRHPKEYKLKYEGINGNRSFYYGKLNSLYFLFLFVLCS